MDVPLAVLPSPGLTATMPTMMRTAARKTAPAETNLFIVASCPNGRF